MSNPLKIGLVGAGSIARAHLPAYQDFPDEVKLTAVCDLREDAAQSFADDAGGAEVYTDFEAMLQNPDVDAVDICTIHDQHHYQVIAAADAGKQILLEKPLGISLAECREMLEATDKAGTTFMVAQCLRFLPQSQKVKALIDAGEFGNSGRRAVTSACPLHRHVQCFLHAATMLRVRGISTGRKPAAALSFPSLCITSISFVIIWAM